jgi:chemotaxis response regulator CheB
LENPPPPSVLIVDDSSMMRSLLTRLVDAAGGFTVAGTAADGRQAVERARELLPDLCLLDLEMPVMGGLDALPAIRAVSGAAVIVVSSIAGPGSAERRACLLAGAAAVVAKPSGAVSVDLAETRGAAILAAMRAALIPPDAPTEAVGDAAFILPAEEEAGEDAEGGDDGDDDLSLLSLLAAAGEDGQDEDDQGGAG